VQPPLQKLYRERERDREQQLSVAVAVVVALALPVQALLLVQLRRAPAQAGVTQPRRPAALAPAKLERVRISALVPLALLRWIASPLARPRRVGLVLASALALPRPQTVLVLELEPEPQRSAPEAPRRRVQVLRAAGSEPSQPPSGVAPAYVKEPLP
jgi:hypothetical protein